MMRVILSCLFMVSFELFAVDAPPSLRLVGDGSGNIFYLDAPVKLSLQSDIPMSGTCLLEIMDAKGASLQQLNFELPGETKDLPVSFQPPDRRFLSFRATLENRPGEKAEASVVRIPADQPADERLGMNCTSNLSPTARRIGAHWIRNHISWEQGAEDTPLGSAGIDKVIDETAKGGCQVMGISSYSVPWAGVFDKETDKRNMREFFSPPKPVAWDAYVKYAAASMRGRVPAFEVWNEANFDMFWRSTPDTFEQRVADYSLLLKRTYEIMKKEDPKLLITNGSIVNTRAGSGHVFLKSILDSGCGKSFDIANIHYYHGSSAPEKTSQEANEFGFDGTLESYIRGFRSVLDAKSCKQPIWLTEIGWTTTPPPWAETCISPKEQAEFLVRSHFIAYGNGVKAVAWFALVGEPYGILDLQKGPKPAVAAYAQMARVLAGRKTVARLPDRPVYAYMCQGASDAVLVAWALEDTKWKIPDGFIPAKSEDIFGEPVEKKEEKEISLTTSPVYLFGINKEGF